ncbi:MAG: D-alanine--D-alanine ligase [Elusimicrobia bacterium]|jgi:D-alanine-D-alanine ligase|nr:D-alanine--D-alanine ligase [Elusimicrobiota bacterium]
MKSKKSSKEFGKIILLTGGNSPESEVSLKSAASVEKAFIELGIDYRLIMADGNFMPGLVSEDPDLVFIAMHGNEGENGSMQGMLDVFAIPYTGSGVLASALCMDKICSKEIFDYNNIRTPVWQEVKSSSEIKLKLPVVVKPVSGGSTIATTIVRKKEDLKAAVKKVVDTGDRIIVEKYIPGRELTVGVIDGKALPVLEIISKTEFYDYRAKYETGMSGHGKPEGLSKDILNSMMTAAEKAYEVTNCRGAVRVDFRLDSKKYYILEINTIPGMTETSLLPEAAQLAGIDFNCLITDIIKSAQKI